MYGYPRGRVKISAYSPDGKEQILALLGPGDLFGELTPVGPRGAVRVEAFAQSIVCSLHRTLFEDVIKIGPVPARPAVAQPIFRTALIR